jgi:hypothetical protein
MHLALIIGKICRHLLAENYTGQVRNLQAAADRVVIGNSHEIHADFTKPLVQLEWIRITGWKLKTAKDPVGSARAVTRMNVQICFRL